MKIFGQLEAAQFEQLAADPTGVGLVEGRFWYNTVEKSFKGYTDSKIVDLDNRDLTLTEYTQQASTPTVPAAGNNLIYFKTDGTPYTLDENGNETPLGGGGGGSKNYFEDVDAEIDSTIGAWLTDDGVGGASAGLTLSVTAVAGELLAGVNSLKLVKDAADRDGHFIKVGSETIDPSDRGRPNYGSFEFRPGTGYVNSDLIFEVYDVTNAAVLYSGVAADLELLNSRGRFPFVTYLVDTTAQVEFRVKINNANTNGFDAFFDEFKFGPVAQIPGVYRNSELIDLTGSGQFTAGTIQVDRIGNLVNIQTITALTFASAATATSAAGVLPEWATPAIDRWNLYLNNGANYIARAQASAAGGVSVDFSNFDGSDSAETTDSGFMSISFAVEEDNKNTLMNTNELSQQTIVASIYRAATQVISTTAETTIELDTVDFDPFGLFELANNGLRISKSGYYKINSKIQVTSLADQDRLITEIQQNAGVVVRYLEYSSGNGELAAIMTRIAYLNKGDLLDLTTSSSSDSSYNVRGGSADTFLEIESLPDYTVLGVVKNEEYLETIIASATTTTLANTETDVTGSELPLTEGTWTIGYDLDVITRNNVASLNTQFGSVMVTDDSNNRIPEMETLTGGVMAPDTEIGTTASKQKKIILTEPTTLKIRIASLDAAATGTMGVRNTGNVTGGLPGDDSASRFWARREK